MSHRRLALACTIALLVAACGDDGGADLDTAAAAAGAQAAIDEGDTLGDCPMGTPAELMGAIEDELPGEPALIEDTIDDGQVFFGGQVPITYCTHSDFGDDPDRVSDVRLDASPGSDVDAEQWIDENFTDPDDLEFVETDDIEGGATRMACWDERSHCHVFWQGDDVFVGVTTIAGDGAVSPETTEAVARTLVPLAVTNLAAT